VFYKNKSNKQVKIARYHSLGLLKSGAMLRFLKAPYLSRYICVEINISNWHKKWNY